MRSILHDRHHEEASYSAPCPFYHKRLGTENVSQIHGCALAVCQKWDEGNKNHKLLAGSSTVIVFRFVVFLVLGLLVGEPNDRLQRKFLADPITLGVQVFKSYRHWGPKYANRTYFTLAHLESHLRCRLLDPRGLLPSLPQRDPRAGGRAGLALRSKVPQYGVCMVSIVGIILLILGRYSVFGYLDPEVGGPKVPCLLFDPGVVAYLFFLFWFLGAYHVTISTSFFPGVTQDPRIKRNQQQKGQPC